MLLRATEGPMMELGPEATSVLTYGHPFSAAAFQQIGKGLALLIGPDPQGGDLYHEVDRSRLTTGEKLKTDTLLANAVAYLLDRTSNIIPNSGFEQNTDLPPAKSNWEVDMDRGAEISYPQDGAPEGSVCIGVTCPNADSSAIVRPSRPLVVERGREYSFRCLHRSTAGWEIVATFLRGNLRRPEEEEAARRSVALSGPWASVELTISIPNDVSYLRLELGISDKGELSLDDLSLRRAPG